MEARSMRSLVKAPFTYLIIQAMALFAVYSHVIGYGIQTTFDSKSYVEFPFDDLAGVLGNERTFGYAAFIKLIQLGSPDFGLLPPVQMVIFLLAVPFFYHALTVYGFSKWGAFFVASPILYCRLLREYFPYIMTDVLAASLSLIAVGFFLLLLSDYRRLFRWAGFIVSVFLAYQVRPVYLFLLPMFTVLALVLIPFREEGHAWKRYLGKYAVGVAIACFLPFALFCALRYVAVGHFGLVSFAGINLVGITTQFLSKDAVKQFDESLKPLAMAILELRDQKNLGVPQGHTMVPMTQFTDYYYRNYYVDGVLDPIREAARETARKEGHSRLSGAAETIEANNIATRLAFATIRARPWVHIFYYAKSFLYSVSFTLYVEPAIVFLLLLLFVTHLGIALRDKISREKRIVGPWSLHDTMEFNTILVTAVLFYLAKLLLVISVEPPHGRYFMPAALFIPSVIAGAWFITLKRAIASGKAPR
jgi:hypothetical protein